MFERFTEKAIKVIMLAHEEAKRLGHNFLGTEQLLLGIIGEGTTPSAKILNKNGVTLKAARHEVEKIIGKGSGFIAVEIPFTPRAKKVLETAIQLSNHDPRESIQKSGGISCDHLLLAILKDDAGIAVRVLENLGLASDTLREQVYNSIYSPRVEETKTTNNLEKVKTTWEDLFKERIRELINEVIDEYKGNDENGN